MRFELGSSRIQTVLNQSINWVVISIGWTVGWNRKLFFNRGNFD